MNLRSLILILLVATCSSALAKPNVVIFLADDAGWGDYSHSGNQQVRTPHIDSLARGGVSLARFFVQPVCAPTRAEFLTGRYPPRGGVRGSAGRSTEEILTDLDRSIAQFSANVKAKFNRTGEW